MTDRSISGIPLSEVRNAYERRGLDRLSDYELVRQTAEILAVPRNDPADSFVLHSPLELAARSALLPLVAPEQRTLARIRIVALAAHYEQYQALKPVAAQLPPATPISAKNRLLAAIAGGDVQGAGEHAQSFASAASADRLNEHLVRDLVPMTAAAAHAPIFLFHLARRDQAHGLSPQLAVPLARELARHPDWRIRWVDRWIHRDMPETPTDPARLRVAIAELPLLGPPGSTFIHPLLMQVDEGGIAKQHLGQALGQPTPEAGAELLRIAARLMLTDTPDEGPYGWSHCLTIPQAILGITKYTMHADVGLAVAATHVAAFRVGLGKEPLGAPREFRAEHGARTITALATKASVSHDAHVVKYVLACIDAAIDDPAASGLYYAAAQRLLDIWIELGGDPSDPLT